MGGAVQEDVEWGEVRTSAREVGFFSRRLFRDFNDAALIIEATCKPVGRTPFFQAFFGGRCIRHRHATEGSAEYL